MTVQQHPENEWTAGPWRVVNCDVRPTEGDDGRRLFDIRAGEMVNSTYEANVTGAIDCGGVSIAMVGMNNREADARLIAAAPDFAAVAPDAVELLNRYAAYIRDDVRADDLERHPYLPELERVADALASALAKATSK